MGSLRKLIFNKFRGIYANDNDAFIPELWANHTLVILEENMVIGNLVYRDFENELQNFGDIVNTRKPNEFTAIRKVDGDDITAQDAGSPNIQVPLNQWFHTSFYIYDGESTKSFKDLAQIYAGPAALSLRRAIDKVILGQYAGIINAGYFAGNLGSLTNSTAQSYMIETREMLNRNKAPMEGRVGILGPGSESEVLKTDIFVSAERVGDNGTALREASIGKKFGQTYFMCQNMAEVSASGVNLVKSGAVNFASGYSKGYAGELVVDGFTGSVAVGHWITIAGHPYRIAAETTSTNTVGITLHIPLVHDVADNAVINEYGQALVNNSGGYAAGYAKGIVYDATTANKHPQVGQIISFGTTPSAAPAVYTVIQQTTATTTTGTIYLDRPLEAAIADNAVINQGPPGWYNLHFTRGAIAFVNRPLTPPPSGTGARSATKSTEWLAMRVTISYNSTKQATLITMDLLCGIKILEPLEAAVMLG